WLTPGSLFAIVVWLGLGFVFRFYVERWGKYNQTYGTVGGVVILLLFFYIDAVVLLIGAEIDSEVDFEVLKIRRGTRDFTKAGAFSGRSVSITQMFRSPALPAPAAGRSEAKAMRRPSCDQTASNSSKSGVFVRFTALPPRSPVSGTTQMSRLPVLSSPRASST